MYHCRLSCKSFTVYAFWNERSRPLWQPRLSTSPNSKQVSKDTVLSVSLLQPGGTLLITAHRELERLTLDRETAHFQQALSARYAELVYYGLWFSPLREALDGFFDVAQQRVTGSVGLKLWKGTLNVTKRVSPYSLYRADLASFTMGRYNPKDAEGFINLFALPVTVRPKAKAEGHNS